MPDRPPVPVSHLNVWRDGDDLLVTWRGGSAATSVFVSDDPDDAGVDVRAPDAPGRAVIGGVGPRRRYVHVFDPAGGFVVAAERAPLVEGAVNLRDVGGLPTAGGGTVRWGRLWRSGRLDAVTDAGLEAMAALGITTVVDLRTPDEAAAAPDRLPDGVTRLERPLSSDPSGLRTIGERIRRGELTRYGVDDLAAGYVRILERCGPVVAEVADLLTADAGGVLVHCTAGKDRTGLVIMALLSAVGVPEPHVLDDYELSERHLPADRGRDVERLLGEHGLDPAAFVALWSAPRRALGATLRAIDRRWGGVHAYLDAHGIDAETRARLAAAVVRNP